MTKLAIASLALAVAGVGALAAVGVTRIANGQCPLSGRPIHCHAAPEAAQSAPSLASDAIAAPQTTVAAEEAECPVSHATNADAAGHAQCPHRAQCAKDCAEDAPPECCKEQCEKKAPAEKP